MYYCFRWGKNVNNDLTYIYIHIQYLVSSQIIYYCSNRPNLLLRQKLSRKQNFYQHLQTDLSSPGILSSDQISEIMNIYSGPCPIQHLYRVGSPTPLRVVAKEELFDLFEKVHTEGGKHLGGARLFVELKQHYTAFPRDIVLAFIKSCSECQLQKCKKSLKSTVVKPLHSLDFA